MHELDIGGKIRGERKRQRVSIAILSEQSGVSKSMISQIERNLAIPSSVVLWKIAKVLGKSISYFFGEEDLVESVVMVKQGDHGTIQRDSKKNNGYFELLSPKDKREIDLLKITIEPGGKSKSELITHDGEECGYVIKGRLTVKTQGKDYYLEEGDSIQFDSKIPHMYANESDEECISIWAMQAYKW